MTYCLEAEFRTLQFMEPATRRIFASSNRLVPQWRLTLVAPFQPTSTFLNV